MSTMGEESGNATGNVMEIRISGCNLGAMVAGCEVAQRLEGCVQLMSLPRSAGSIVFRSEQVSI